MFTPDNIKAVLNDDIQMLAQASVEDIVTTLDEYKDIAARVQGHEKAERLKCMHHALELLIKAAERWEEVEAYRQERVG